MKGGKINIENIEVIVYNKIIGNKKSIKQTNERKKKMSINVNVKELKAAIKLLNDSKLAKKKIKVVGITIEKMVEGFVNTVEVLYAEEKNQEKIKKMKIVKELYNNLAEQLDAAANEKEDEKGKEEVATKEKKAGKKAEKVEKKEVKKIEKDKSGKKKMGIGAFVIDGLLNNKFKDKTNKEILEFVKLEFPEANTTPGCIGWYKNKLKKEGKI